MKPPRPQSPIKKLTSGELANLYLARRMSIHQLARTTGFSRRTISRWLRQSGIPYRTQGETNEMLRRHALPAKETLERLYLEQRLSSSQIGERLGGTGSWVLGLLQRYDIRRRTTSEAGIEFVKTPFSNDPAERAYLLGFRAGDLHARKDGNQVRIGTSTTHPSMWNLIQSLFHNYGRVNKSPSRLRNDFECPVYGYLDSTFEFLINKPSRVPEEISRNPTLFLGFLAGYIDAEGNFRIYCDDGRCAYSVRVNSEDEGILRDIKAALSSLGYHPYFRLERRRGFYKGRNYRRDVWQLAMFRKDEILDLLQNLPLRHPEKVEWARLVSSSNGKSWSSVEPHVINYRRQIKSEVQEFTREAKDKYLASHHSVG